MRHRWNKGKKESNTLPNGEKIIHITVGGRTSAVVPSVQKKTGPVAGDVASGDESDTESIPKKKVKKESNDAKMTPKPKAARKGRVKKEETDSEEEEDIEEVKSKSMSKKRKGLEGKAEVEKTIKKVKSQIAMKPESGRRRSGRNGGR